MWYGVDKLTEKYPTVCGYVYTLDNPVKFIDELRYKPSLSALRKAAKKLGVELSVIRTVFQTETEGQTYTKDGRIKILYERHYFSRFTHGKYDKDRDISAPTPFKGKTHKEKGKVVATPEIDRYGNLPNQYRRFEKAKKLDEEAAYSSIRMQVINLQRNLVTLCLVLTRIKCSMHLQIIFLLIMQCEKLC